MVIVCNDDDDDDDDDDDYENDSNQYEQKRLCTFMRLYHLHLS